MKLAYIDIGELGYSLYLSAHIKWLLSQGRPAALVMTYPDRKCLYEDWVEKVVDVPSEFYKDFDIREQKCFKIGNVGGKELRAYFNEKLPEGYCVSGDMDFDMWGYHRVYAREKLFVSYPHKKELIGKKEILVIPRCRPNFKPYNLRNLPRVFYIRLIEALCSAFEDCIIRAVGTRAGAYNLIEIKKNNYVNSVGSAPNLQTTIDRCQITIGAVGVYTTILLLAMMQGVPTFGIGHEEQRFEDENWLKTKFNFHKIGEKEYNEFKNERAIANAISFFKEAREENVSR